MKVYKNIDELPAFKRAVITIGSFDGVHHGHLQIINQIREEASKIDGTAVVITFFPHPKMIVGKENNPILILNTPDEKKSLLEKSCIDNLVEIPFNSEFAEMSAEDYIENFLVGCFHPHTIIVGYDHRFGKNRKGDFKLLESLSSSYGYCVKEIPEHVLKNITISSTEIRNELMSGNVETACELLGYRYFFSGTVTEGNKLGRTIGFPTANLEITDKHKLIPANGVYAVDVQIAGSGQFYKGMMNIGTRPTLELHQKTIEVHIFDFNEDIYGTEITVHLKKRLRDEKKFSGLDSLKLQLEKDKNRALNV